MDIKDFAHLPLISKEKVPEIKWEYQSICLDCEKFFGKDKKIWIQPHRVGVTENLMRYSLKECITRKKPFINYFISIINNQIIK